VVALGGGGGGGPRGWWCGEMGRAFISEGAGVFAGVDAAEVVVDCDTGEGGCCRPILCLMRAGLSAQPSTWDRQVFGGRGRGCVRHCMCCDPRVGGMGVGWAGFADEDLHVWEVVHASSILLTAVWRTA
jgi:hypothetical protein